MVGVHFRAAGRGRRRDLDEAVTEMIKALREYAGDRQARLSDSPNHRENRVLVQFVGLSSDEQLRDWVIGAAQLTPRKPAEFGNVAVAPVGAVVG